MMVKVSRMYALSQPQIAREGYLVRGEMFLKPGAVRQNNALLRT